MNLLSKFPLNKYKTYMTENNHINLKHNDDNKSITNEDVFKEKTNIKDHKLMIDEDNELNSIINHFSNAIDKNPSSKYTFKGNNEEYKLYSKKDENLLQKNKGIFVLSQTESQKSMLFTTNLLKVNEINICWIGSKKVFKTHMHIAFNNSFSYYSSKSRVVKMREISLILEGSPYKFYSTHTKESINTFTISPNRINDKINNYDKIHNTESDIQNTSNEHINAKKSIPHNKQQTHHGNQTKFTTEYNYSSNLDQTEYERVHDYLNKDLPITNLFRNDKGENQYNQFDHLTRNPDVKLPKIKNKNGNLKEVAVIFPQDISYQAKKEEIMNQKSEFINFYNNLLNERSFAYQNSYYLNGMKNMISRRKRQPVSNSMSMHNIISEFSNLNRDYVTKLMSPKLSNEVEEPTIYDLKRIVRDRRDKPASVNRSNV